METGEKYNRLTFICKTVEHQFPSGKTRWKGNFKCDCGKIKEIFIRSVMSGNTKSCGCLNVEVHRNLLTTHGKSYTKIYGIWEDMMVRASVNRVKNEKIQRDYVNRGIFVCEEWLSFDNFEKDMLPTYQEGLTLDRIDNSLGYFKENCRWATISEQNFNKNNYKISIHTGKTGVFFRPERPKKYYAKIEKLENGIKKREIKSFEYLFDAILWRMQKEQEYWGFCKH
jgi:hypothetical protein